MPTEKELLAKAMTLLEETMNILINDKLDLIKRYSAFESEVKAHQRTEAGVTPVKASLLKPNAAPSGEKPVTAMPTGQPKEVNPANWEFPDKPKLDINHLNPSDQFDHMPPVKPKQPNPPINDLPFDHDVPQLGLKPRIASPPSRPIPPRANPDPEGDTCPF